MGAARAATKGVAKRSRQREPVFLLSQVPFSGFGSTANSPREKALSSPLAFQSCHRSSSPLSW